MPKEVKRRYAINFDLTIEELKKNYSEKYPKRAYREIARFMEKNGFKHRQWSGYISAGTMSKTELVDFTTRLHNKFPWLIKCEKSMDATVITNIFDIKQMIIDSTSDSFDIDIFK